MLAVIDYGVGNLFSLRSSLEFLGVETVVTSDKTEIEKADRIILPGVGAFEDAAKKLRDTGMAELVKRQANSGKPVMGICLGMQLLFEKSFEYGVHEGLGLIEGFVRPLTDIVPRELKIPQMGWNALEFTKPDCPVFKYIENGDYVYFVHSYYAADCDKDTAAVCDYGARVTAAVSKGNVFGCQFHPEKSGDTGLSILKAFSEV
ncbi:MAG: imidazole glycerol phosphate synthase subunit HisH [Clostridiales bacterium]|nr:imidazole glycerol phosphate synthase subunit HisH [Clostridiales bacterium]